jgi:hypothetical protein
MERLQLNKSKIEPSVTAMLSCFPRGNSKRWQCRIRRYTGEWVDYSTKETDLEKAKQIAEERYRDIKYRQETGKIDVTRRFGDVARVVRRELQKESKEKGIRKYKDYVIVIDRHLIPLLGKFNAFIYEKCTAFASLIESRTIS